MFHDVGHKLSILGWVLFLWNSFYSWVSSYVFTDHDEKVHFVHSVYSRSAVGKEWHLESDPPKSPICLVALCPRASDSVSLGLSFSIYKMGSYHLPLKIPVMIQWGNNIRKVYVLEYVQMCVCVRMCVCVCIQYIPGTWQEPTNSLSFPAFIWSSFLRNLAMLAGDPFDLVLTSVRYYLRAGRMELAWK